MEKIKVVIKYPNKDPEISMIKNDYSEISNICGGLIDMVSLPTDETIDIICNDEFLYNGMEANIVTPENNGVLAGPLIFAGYNSETGDSISLTDDQVNKVMKYIKRNRVFNMSLEGAFRYSKVIAGFQQAEDEAGVKTGEAFA